MDEPSLPRPRTDEALLALQREDLELHSVEGLAERIEALQAEIERARAAMDKKRQGRAAADALFFRTG